MGPTSRGFYHQPKQPFQTANGEESPIVETIGFEPTTPWLQTRCSARLSYVPKMGPAL